MSTRPPAPPFEVVDLSGVCNVEWDAFRRSGTAGEASSWANGRYRGIPFLVGGRDGEARADRARRRGGCRSSPDPDRPAGQTRRVRSLPPSTTTTRSIPASPAPPTSSSSRAGTVVEVPIRILMEIGAADDPWGLHPRLARSDRKESLDAALRGSVDRRGGSADRGRGRAPGRPLLPVGVDEPATRPRRSRRSSVRAAGPRFAIGAITLGHLDEPVFYRAAKRAVRIELPDPDDAGRPFALEVEVDRGVATYPYPLPAQGPRRSWTIPCRASGSRGIVRAAPRTSRSPRVPRRRSPSARGARCSARSRYGDLEAERAARARPLGCASSCRDPGRNWVRTRRRRRPDRGTDPVPDPSPLAARGSRSSRTGTIRTSSRTWRPGTSTSAATCSSATRPTRTSTGGARGGCREAMSSSTSPAGSSTSRFGRRSGSSPDSGSSPSA